MPSASNQKHGYLAVVEQVEYEEKGGRCGDYRAGNCRSSARHCRRLRTLATRRVHNYIGAPRVTMPDAVAFRARTFWNAEFDT
jgi:hypothetical protein